MLLFSDGLGRSGTFAALNAVIERVKVEQVIDVFQAIKAMRIQRAHLVKTLVSCHICIVCSMIGCRPVPSSFMLYLVWGITLQTKHARYSKTPAIRNLYFEVHTD